MSAEQDLANANVQIANLITEVTRFRDSAMGLNNIYATVTEGRQNTDDGKYFSVPGSGAYMRLYRRQGTTAELIAEFADRAEINGVLDQLAPLLGRGVVGGSGALLAKNAYGIGSTTRDIGSNQNVNLKTLERGIYGANRPSNDSVVGLPAYVSASEYSAHIPINLSSPNSPINTVLSFLPGVQKIIWGIGDGTEDPAGYVPLELIHNKKLLGLVSMSGGFPSGSVIERGSNDFGEYQILADGTMEQFISDQVFPYNSAAALSKTLLLPKSFSGAHKVHIQLAFPSAGGNYIGSINSLSVGNVVYNTTTNSIINDVGVSILRTRSSPDFAPGDQVTGVQALLKGRVF
ncbi:hypothetical protein [Vreelandella boliviensis]|uniref:hypothetical protein n=1 Tax=Vreelandella boliviensis TaxID=223527 RepID=UPI001B8BC38D|nr:hypothetical protein [Halomonas boliviensis]MBS3670210.1 hypothetical protein [Halomonas boliviensis]